MDTRCNHFNPLERLELSSRTPLASGCERLVFVHPTAADLVVKVVRPDRRQVRDEQAGKWFRRRLRLRHHTLFLREIREYLALRARFPDRPLPLARIVGLVETDLGLGLVSELVRLADGVTAPTLAQLVDSGTSLALLRQAVERFERELLPLDIVVNDINRSNLVATQADDGNLRLLLVDGFGDKNFIRLRSMSRFLNHRNTRRRIARLLASLADPPPAAQSGALA